MTGTVSATLRELARDCRALPRKVVDDVVKSIASSVDKRLARDTGGDRRLSGAPTRLRVSTSVKGDRVAVGTVEPGRAGMAQWSWLEYGTGAPGPTRPKHTWSEPASDELETAARRARARLDSLMD